MLVGPAASKAELARFRRKLKARPAGYIAQPTLALSTVPVLTQVVWRRATSTYDPLF